MSQGRALGALRCGESGLDLRSPDNNNNMPTTRLLVFDTSSEFIDSLEQYAKDLPDLDVLGISDDVDVSIDHYESEPPDVIFYASSLLQTFGTGSFLRVCQKWPEARCYRLTVFDESYYGESEAGEGFTGSVPRSEIEEHLDRIVQEVRAMRDSANQKGET